MEVVEENARLELEKRSSFNESVSLEEELTQARLQMAPSGETSSSDFSLFGVEFSISTFYGLCFFSLYLFLLHVFSYNITPST